LFKSTLYIDTFLVLPAEVAAVEEEIPGISVILQDSLVVSFIFTGSGNY